MIPSIKIKKINTISSIICPTIKKMIRSTKEVTQRHSKDNHATNFFNKNLNFLIIKTNHLMKKILSHKVNLNTLIIKILPQENLILQLILRATFWTPKQPK